MARLAEESGGTLVDLPCGYTPRAIEFAKKGLSYYGLDLPAVIQEAAEKIPALIPPEQRKLVRFQAVDATNYASLEKALEDVDGPVCITTKACKDGVSLHDENEVVSEILSQTGFDSIFH